MTDLPKTVAAMPHNGCNRAVLLLIATALLLLPAGGVQAEKKSFDGDSKSAVPDTPSGRTGGFGMGPGSSRLTTPSDSGSASSPNTPSSSGTGSDRDWSGYGGGGAGGGGAVRQPRGPSPEEIERQRRYQAAVAATEAGREAYRRGEYEEAIRLYERARAEVPGSYADELIANARAAIAIRDALREANALSAQGKDAWARDHRASWTAYERAADYYLRALKYAPGDQSILAGLKIVRGNAAAARANYAFYVIGDVKNALAYYQQAVKNQPDNKDFRDNLERARAAVQNQKEFEASNSSIRRIGSDLARSVSSDAAGVTSSERGNTPFGTPAVMPSDIPFAPIAPGQVPRSENTAAAADSAKRSGAAAVAARKQEQASTSARCQFDGSAAPDCHTGTPLPTVAVAGRPPTQAQVFPGLSPSEWTKLQREAGGKELVARADRLLNRRAELEEQLRRIKASPNASQRQQEMIDQDTELQKVNKEISGLQPKARQIINVYVLDDKGPKRNREPPLPESR